MNPEQAAAFIIAQAVSAFGEIVAMQTTNADHAAIKLAQDCNMPWQHPPYSANDFRAVADKFGIGHNAVISFFQEVNR